MKFASEFLSHGLAKARNQHYDCRKVSEFGERKRERALELRISLLWRLTISRIYGQLRDNKRDFWYEYHMV